MKKRSINLWFEGSPEGPKKCIETVPAFEENKDGPLYVSLELVRKMLEYEWPEGRWAVRYDEIDDD